MTEPRWIALARTLLGIHETPGPDSNPDVVQMFKDIRRGGIKDDAVPWCAAFVGAVLERSGIPSTRFESAKSYLSWGTTLSAPAHGCIVVFTRDGGGHVGFVVGRDAHDNLLVLGGNQGDAVCIKAFPTSRVSGYRWPAGEPRNGTALTFGAADVSHNEA